MVILVVFGDNAVVRGVLDCLTAPAPCSDRLRMLINDPPVPELVVLPTGPGMQRMTEFRFDGTASSDPDEDELVYRWDFGDGTSSSAAMATHTYGSAGDFEVSLTISDGTEQATKTDSVTIVRNLDGAMFRGFAESVGHSEPMDPGLHSDLRIEQTLRLIQQGQDEQVISGNVEIAFMLLSTFGEGDTTIINGNIDGSSNFVCPCPIQVFGRESERVYSYGLEGTIDEDARRIDGTFELDWSGARYWGPVTLVRQ